MISKNDVLNLYQDCLYYLKECHPEYFLMVKQYSFGFGRKKRAFGTCHYRTKEIKIHMYSAKALNLAHIKDTILHEMAHAIDKEKHGYSSGHGYNWKSICGEIGCKAKSSSKVVENVVLESKYVMVLVKNDGYEYVQPIHRITKTKPLNTFLMGTYLRGRKNETINKLQVVTFNEFKSNQLPIDKK